MKPEPTDIEESLIDRKAFDQRGERPQDFEYTPGHIRVGPTLRNYNNGSRTPPASFRHRHCRAHAESAGFVAGGSNHSAWSATSDKHRPSHEVRVSQPFDLDEEGVHVDVEDRFEPWLGRARERLEKGPEAEMPEIAAWRRA